MLSVIYQMFDGKLTRIFNKIMFAQLALFTRDIVKGTSVHQSFSLGNLYC